MSVKNLEPRAMWSHFADLNAVPRPSKKEERVIQFMMDFGNSLGLETIKDAIGNVVIKKAASPGMEDRKIVIMQSHLDMVHQKNSDTVFDFDNQGIEMIIDGDWVRANGTTLGADNGIGVATIMAILTSTDIAHPPIEAMFTVDEETGMTGAMELDPSNFDGEILLNLDTEDDDEISIGCAGGIDSNTSMKYTEVDLWEDAAVFELKISGLIGGHSGMDIDKGRGNANKMMNRILQKLMVTKGFQLISIDGGSLRNAIPRESVAVFAINHDFEGMLDVEFSSIALTLKTEYASIEKEMNLALNPVVSNTAKAVGSEDLPKIIRSIYACHNGVFRMSSDIEGLVETSSSLARVIVGHGDFTTQSLQRSSVESTKDDVANTIRASFEAVGCEVVQNGDYPGWQPNKDSEILTILRDLYVKKFNEEPQVKACHAGLECGILSQHLPKVDMISFGPNIRAAHSPDEKVQISSVQKFWDYLLEVLVLIPKKSA
ncbi:MAG: aminoacyl-histidine dipeptidase [Crocinitomicaceae bacterium]|nr:aminoacyl-histidine dipeptidase [Crocinitomicaceae bacterium]